MKHFKSKCLFSTKLLLQGVTHVICCTGTTAFPSKRWDGDNTPEKVGTEYTLWSRFSGECVHTSMSFSFSHETCLVITRARNIKNLYMYYCLCISDFLSVFDIDGNSLGSCLDFTHMIKLLTIFFLWRLGRC